MRSLFAALAAMTMLTTAAIADSVPQLVNYQGKVYQPSGAAVPDGAYKIAFSIYDVPTGGTAIWTETYDALQVKGSAFHVLLGSTNPIGASIFGSAERFLGVKLASDPELAPRQKIASVPYAMVAEKAASADIAQTVPDGAITAEKVSNGAISTVHLSSSLAISAAAVKQEPWTEWTLAYGGFSSPPTSRNRYLRFGNMVVCNVYPSVAGQSNATTFTITLPVKPRPGSNYDNVILVADNSVVTWGTVNVIGGSVTASVTKAGAHGAFTAGGGKYFSGVFCYEAE